jgi:hypothetical protein
LTTFYHIFPFTPSLFYNIPTFYLLVLISTRRSSSNQFSVASSCVSYTFVVDTQVLDSHSRKQPQQSKLWTVLEYSVMSTFPHLVSLQLSCSRWDENESLKWYWWSTKCTTFQNFPSSYISHSSGSDLSWFSEVLPVWTIQHPLCRAQPPLEFVYVILLSLES